MQPERAESIPLHVLDRLTEAELCSLCRLSSRDVEELVEYGALAPIQAADGQERLFSASCATPLRQASMLRAQFDLDLFTLGLLYSQLERIARLEQQVRALKVQLGTVVTPVEAGVPIP